jgi:hypothetical protein
MVNLIKLFTFRRLEELAKARFARNTGQNSLRALGSTQGLGLALARNAKNSHKMKVGGW